MKRLSKLDLSAERPEVIRSKRIFGMVYGIMAGITFACASWGMDGYLLSQLHGYLPWFNLIAGMILCSIVAGTLGWLTARLEKSLCSVPSGIVFLDMITNFEKIGDHLSNIAERIEPLEPN